MSDVQYHSSVRRVFIDDFGSGIGGRAGSVLDDDDDDDVAPCDDGIVPAAAGAVEARGGVGMGFNCNGGRVSAGGITRGPSAESDVTRAAMSACSRAGGIGN